MTMHDERWTLGVAENGDVRLRDQKTGETRGFGGNRALFDALGVLADWREAATHKSHYGVTERSCCGTPAMAQVPHDELCERGASGPNPYEGKTLDELGEIMSSDGYRNPPQHNADYARERQMRDWLARRGVGLTPTPGTVARGVATDHAEALTGDA
jgi:hypothetical protein